MFYIFDLAQNHQGDVVHAKRIIDAVSKIIQHHKISAGIKLQFRQLSDFVAPQYQESDIKLVKRLRETSLTFDDFKEIVQYIREKNLTVVATPFDNGSLLWIDELNIDVVKVASCSIDDWVLLEDVAKINKKIIISTAGADSNTLQEVYDLFQQNKRDFAFLHCVAEYPTPHNHAGLARIGWLKRLFPNVEIGYSTHESPHASSLCPYAIAMGCTIIEKHVGLPTNEYTLNEYSCSPHQLTKHLDQIHTFNESWTGSDTIAIVALNELKRYMYVKNKINVGDRIKVSDLFFAIPRVNEEHLCVSDISKIINMFAIESLEVNVPLLQTSCTSEFLLDIKTEIKSLLTIASVTTTSKDKIELSAHYGINKFREIGCCIIEKVNRTYCKKIIVVLPGQSHPTHHHLRKEETFELLYGDCKLVVNDKLHELELGNTIVINPKDRHGFSSENGCVFEEISTTHYTNDSIYEEPSINKLPLDKRKILIQL